jgi:hypothetical protein
MSFKQCLVGWYLAAAAALLPAPSNAALLGVNPEDPKMDFGGSGVAGYDSALQILTISGVPATLIRNDPFLFAIVGGTGVDDDRLFTIKLRVSPTGMFQGGVDGPDIEIIGSVDVNGDGSVVYAGTLLQAEVTHFGFQDSAFGTTDGFDLRATVTGGSLMPLYTNPNIAIQVFSEASTEYPNPFTGSFAADWTGAAKGVLGNYTPTVVGQCKIDVEAYCSVGGGPFTSKCRIAQYKSPKYWDHETRTNHGRTYKRFVYGYHGHPEPAWSVARPQEATSVTFKYVVKNTGTTPITGVDIDDSFDTDVTGYPTTLAVGASFSVTRTEKLREEMDNSVLATGMNGTYQCSDNDTVVVKEKLRERRRYDDDKYRDKGKDDTKDRR